MEADSLLAVRRGPVRPGRLPDGTLLSASVGGIDGLHAVQVMKIEDVLAGQVRADRQVRLRDVRPVELHVLRGRPVPLRKLVLHRRLEHLPVRAGFGKTEALSNAETGFFHPMPQDDGSMIVFRYSGDGFVPATIDPKPLEDVSAITFLGAELAEKHPIVKDWKVGSPAKIPFDDSGRRPRTLSSRSRASARSRSIRSSRATSTPRGRHAVQFLGPHPAQPLHAQRQLFPRLEPALRIERLHLRLQYRRYDWKVDAKLNGADFYDLFGPTKIQPQGILAAHVVGPHALPGSPAQADHDGGRRVLRRPRHAPVLPGHRLAREPARDARSSSFEFENIRGSLGRVDAEKGQRAKLYLSETYTPGSTCNTATAPGGVCDVATAPPGGSTLRSWRPTTSASSSPIVHSSIWLRSAAGAGSAIPLNPYAQYFFGAFGNNWVDNGEIRRYREFYAFPGLAINEIGGRTFAKAILDWNLPPIRFLHFGTPGFYGSWIRTSVFVGDLHQLRSPLRGRGRAAGASEDRADDRRRRSADGPALHWLSRLDMTLSFGYAAAFESGVAPRHEAMISLKVMQ